ncbi:DUF3173 family protein [Listeria innocua]|jgi:hypothetical protein|uniref:DUF3173 domain-containing protein n=1 Tax=Carnobacterium divergens TaxID=2748 RepID=A0AAW8R7C1_CARDV|nr:MULTISPECIES: DUF3173 family protein [Bacilli]EAA0094070.1 DUF3173 domain-containing protein [Listeria innocua]EAC4268969.1 DUF3173 domain-containing protein [Listeria innocua]EAC6252838.1 DUF3173 domain-containing protein [Listeria monocytogenes]EAD4137645.1 DUF3173 domain-containing protein [Listeria monocytogenes]EAF2586295.1 DUF3173 domain-containing protein [Listeria monocytogenes]
MTKDFEVMISRLDLIHIGFKPHQASVMIREAKEHLSTVEGISFYSNRQVGVVPARIIEKLFDIQIIK